MKNALTFALFFLTMGASSLSFAAFCNVTVDYAYDDCLELASQDWVVEDEHCIFDVEVTNRCEEVVTIQSEDCTENCLAPLHVKPGQTAVLNLGESFEYSESEHRLALVFADSTVGLDVWTNQSPSDWNENWECMVLLDEDQTCAQAGGELPLFGLLFFGFLAIRRR